MCTAKNAAKVPALRHNPAVALTIDTDVHPPRILLIRGRVRVAGGDVHLDDGPSWTSSRASRTSTSR
jgi:hypothetical protein